ncbi:hypothetical protein LZ575_20250 [Antarcticibacterium sp. 1MA-6-2]|uniref:hypothetical protein n=1 Tax=Antarcticibacterium sp. 1MA-6-2 TaxID=2908210 RepID=UPI001F344DE7|nr:hypothetical protein [Antarcticibacterium sp. 1MA-6-2]UJH90982.1 hypothetical protein LZ575_20250 [Antarcticibacterium sp. 1MA-6-2]
MRKSLIPLSLIIVLVALCFYISWFNIVLLALVLLIILYITLATAVRKLKGKKIKPLLGFPLRLIGILLIAIAASFFIPYSPAVIETGDISAELKYAYETDQEDRKNLKSYTGIFQNEIQSRDELRLDQVKKYYSEGNIKKPLDKFHAAFVYHHSDNSADYEVASKLAAEAA